MRLAIRRHRAARAAVPPVFVRIVFAKPEAAHAIQVELVHVSRHAASRVVPNSVRSIFG